MSAALGLNTDLYELRMAQTCLREGLTQDATFSLFIRPDPRRPWFLAAGLEQALEVIADFRYGPAELGYLRTLGLSEDLLDWLEALPSCGEIWAVPEGTIVLGDEPLLEVTAPLPVAMLWETALMNVVHLGTLIATKAARCVLAARGTPIADFGFRRAHGLETGVEAARSAYLAGVASTSNVEAGRRHGIPVSGTMAHSLVQAFGNETAAFAAFTTDSPDEAVLLVDTYHTMTGVRLAIAEGVRLRVRGHELAGVRIDSGDLDAASRATRSLLDAAGFPDTRIFVSGGVDEHAIAALTSAEAPIDGYGVGTSMVTSSDRPSVNIVYKLVEYAGEPRAKYSEGKVLLPGAKQVYRQGAAPDGDVLATRTEPSPGGRPLLAPVLRDGTDHRGAEGLAQARARAKKGLNALPAAWHGLDPVAEPPTPALSPALRRSAEELRARDLIENDGG